MSFYLFSVCSIVAVLVLMPINLKNNLGIGGDDDPDWVGASNGTNHRNPPSQGRDWLDLLTDPTSVVSLQLLFTYLFTILTLFFIHKNYKKFIRSRQLFSLELVHSISARTVLVTHLPIHLRSERRLAEHFENMGLSVESVCICRDVTSLEPLLAKRTRALLNLEQAWVDYVGNPSTVESYDPSDFVAAPLVDIDSSGLESQQPRFVVPHRARPTFRPGLFKGVVDAIEYWDAKFQEADEEVKNRRKVGKFRATHTAFITFEKMSAAQIAIQAVHSQNPNECFTCQAPEPRDIIWANMATSIGSSHSRELIVMGMMAILLFFWIFPITGLASLLSYKEIKKSMPWLGRLIDSNERIRAIVQNSLPSVAMITLNALLPFMLEAMTYLQGYRARSWIEYSLLKKYFLFLFVNVIFIFLLASTYWQLVRDLANSPAKIPEKLAEALQRGSARHFFLSYVILQGFGIMPLQLLNLGVIIPSAIMRLFVTRTPRDFAELNAPPMINYGVVYPQAILVFVMTLLYSVVQPLMVIFGAIYFGVAYVVYKYKLLFVFYKPYESQGQAWIITFTRLIWGVIMFLVFMTGIFALKKAFIISSLVSPLLIGTLLWSWYIIKIYAPLSEHVSLSSVCEVERGEETAEVVRLRAGHPVTRSQSNLNRRRYAQNDDTLYVAPEDARTDYSQPPMANWYNGVLNTGKRRYGHPALNGVLPQPWLPLKKGQSIVNHGRTNGTKPDTEQAVVLTLRKRTNVRQGNRPSTFPSMGSPFRSGRSPHRHGPPDEEDQENGESGPTGSHINNRLSFDPASGVIVLPEDSDWLGEESDSDAEYVSSVENQENTASELPRIRSPNKRYATYYHHPERRRQSIPGAFPRS